MNRILFGVLNWGLGHATRCVPIIKELTKAGYEVVLASDGLALDYLRNAFPTLEARTLPAYNVRYSKTKHQLPKLFLQLPTIYFAIRQERALCEKWVAELEVKGVVSDNRLGFRSNKVPSIYITHQLQMQMKYGKKAINFLHNTYFKKFNQVWVPDYNSSELGGALSRNITNAAVKYIGPLSHFDKRHPTVATKGFDFAFILSGPEPLRTRLEQRIFEQNASLTGNILVVRGTNLPIEGADSVLSNLNWEIHNLLDANVLGQKLEQSEVLISRFGYSTLMDLVYLNKKAILIPTPGQPEQEYLAKFHKATVGIQVLREEDLNLSKLDGSTITIPNKQIPFQDWLELFSVFDGNGK